MVIDFSDPSRKIELTSYDWSYNSDTTEITIEKEIPFVDYVVHVEGTSLSGTLTRELHALYNIGNSESMSIMLELVLSVDNRHGTINADREWIIREDTIDLGLPVQIVHQWGMHITDLDKKPEIIQICLWTWTDGLVHFSVSAISSDEMLLNSFIRQIIAFR